MRPFTGAIFLFSHQSTETLFLFQMHEIVSKVILGDAAWVSVSASHARLLFFKNADICVWKYLCTESFSWLQIQVKRSCLFCLVALSSKDVRPEGPCVMLAI
jgi:hypothetical protein